MIRYLYITAFFILYIAQNGKSQDAFDMESFLQKNAIKAEKMKEGVWISLDKEGTGLSPKQGDYIKINYKGQLLDDKIFDQSPDNEPFVFQLGFNQVIEGLDLGLINFKVGEKATLYIPAALGYGNRGAGTDVAPNTPLKFTVELLQILTTFEYDQYMKEQEQKERIAFDKKQKEIFDEQRKTIQDYAIAHKMRSIRTASGLSYAITKEGKGAKIANGDLVKIHYQGVFLDDKVFDSTKDKTFDFVVGSGKVIEGLDEGIRLLNKDAEAYLLLPSKIAYGASDLQDDRLHIPSNSVLIFKIQVVDIIKK